MTTIYSELHTSRQFQGLILAAHPTSGTEDDYEVDDKDKVSRSEDDDADEAEDQEETAAPER